jgi:cellulose synthase/poly-beta-1,6-N-acetylglucosamine synthase-like glycosyltransferase
MYLLDADWHPQPDALERTLSVLEAQDNVAFVQTKRLAFPQGMNLFQKYIAVVEEGCYHVDFEGRQVLGHPCLFSGCCTLFRIEAVQQVGGFQPGHLTEDLDLTNRLWVAGWKGVYLSDVANYGEVPFTYDHYRRQQERWAAGSARALREHWKHLLTTRHLSFAHKLSAIRQNAYFTTTLLTAFAILMSLVTVSWLIMQWNSYAVESYLHLLGQVKPLMVATLYFCILSNFIEPLIMILIKRRRWRDLCHLPMTIWYAWSVLHTYVIGNLKGLLGVSLNWFRTPKYRREQVGPLHKSPPWVRAINVAACLALGGLYWSQGWFFGWFDEFALLLLPAFVLASFK